MGFINIRMLINQVLPAKFHRNFDRDIQLIFAARRRAGRLPGRAQYARPASRRWLF